MNINIVNTCVSLYRVTVAEVWDSLTNLEKKNKQKLRHTWCRFSSISRARDFRNRDFRTDYFRLFSRVELFIELCIVFVQGLQYITILTVLVFIE